MNQASEHVTSPYMLMYLYFCWCRYMCLWGIYFIGLKIIIQKIIPLYFNQLNIYFESYEYIETDNDCSDKQNVKLTSVVTEEISKDQELYLISIYEAIYWSWLTRRFARDNQLFFHIHITRRSMYPFELVNHEKHPMYEFNQASHSTSRRKPDFRGQYPWTPRTTASEIADVAPNTSACRYTNHSLQTLIFPVGDGYILIVIVISLPVLSFKTRTY